MVLQGSGEDRGDKSMSMSPKRSTRLHNFSLPSLKWGSQRHLRCTNTVVDTGSRASGNGERCSPGSNSNESMATHNQVKGLKQQVVSDDDEEGIAMMREKLMLDLKTVTDRMKDVILRNEEEEQKEEEHTVEAMRPWNLRTRRGEGKALVGTDGQKKHNCSSPAGVDGTSTVRLRRNNNTSDETQRVKFSVSLSRKEIEEDFMAMVGHQPPRRPNKRPKIIQKQLDTLFPGLWLTEVTADMYKVLDPNQNGKVCHSTKGKGKGVDVMHLSDSE